MKSRHALILVFIALGSWIQGASVVAQNIPAAVAENYESWIAGFRTGSLSGALGDHHKIQFALTIISNDDKQPDQNTTMIFGGACCVITTTFAVSTEGTVSMARYTPSAVQGGGPGKLPAEDFASLKHSMAHLPDDHSRLPPKGRRMVVQVVTPSGIVARVYDKADPPDEVLSIWRLVGADVWPLFSYPHFKPDERWDKEQFEKTGIISGPTDLRSTDLRTLATSPQGDLAVVENNPSQYFDSTVHIERLKQNQDKPFNPNENTILQIQDTKTRTVIHEFREPMNGRSFVYIYAARFTPDGRYLLVLSSIPDLRVYDTATWQQVGLLPGVPAGAVAYYPTLDWKYGVAAFPTGEVAIVNAATGQNLARIDYGEALQNVVFSPDNSEVAVVTTTTNPDHPYAAHLRIWKTTGTMVHELRPMEATPRDGFGLPQWWPNGKYLLAPTREGHFGGPNVTGIWNVETGRYRGSLDGCLYPDAPWTLFLLKDTKFYKTCNYGLLMWDVDKDLLKIEEFEQSLAQ